METSSRLRGTRYATAGIFTPAEDGSGPFRGIRPRPVRPARGVLEHLMTEGDRLDLLALHYYNDPSLWWRILDANPEITFAGDLFGAEMIGKTILIPRAEEAGR